MKNLFANIFSLHSKEKLPWLQAVFIAIILLFPTLIWIALDNSPFGGDQSQYGTQSVILFRVLVRSPLNWIKLLFAPGEYKAPGIAWFGQFFVTLGYLVGSIDKGLLYSVLVTQLISLVLLFLLIWEMTNHDLASAILGCTILASAPLFIYLSHQYLVESLQTLSIIWFVLIMCFSPHWGKALTISQLIGVTMVAMLAKVSSPLFCFVPGLVALGFAFLPQQSRTPWNWQDKKVLLTMAFVIPISIATTIWYSQNYHAVFLHVASASTGKVAAIWGKEDSFINTLIYWLGSMREKFFPSDLLLLLTLLIIFIIGPYLYTRPQSTKDHFRLFSTAILLQFVVVLIVFSKSSNRTERYLLPVLPYIPILTSLILAKLNKPVFTFILIGIFAVQYSYLYAQNLGFIDVTSQRSAYILPVERRETFKRVLESIVDHTCNLSNTEVVNVLAVDPLIKGDWLAPEPANYVVTKKFVTGLQPPPCHYDYMGGNFFGSSIEDAWKQLQFTNAKFVIITDPNIYAPPANAYNQTLNEENIFTILDYLENKGDFRMISRLPEDPGILIFQRLKNK